MTEIRRRISDIDDFQPQDGNYFKRWDIFQPLFDNFYILGPEVFNLHCNPTCLFQYPLIFEKINISESPNIEKYQIRIKNNGSQLTHFLYPDGIHFIENDENYRLIDSSTADTFSKPPKVYDRMIYIKNEAGVPHYYFCLRFRCSPFSRPAAFGLDEFERLVEQIKDDDFNSDHAIDQIKKLYVERMKKYFMNDFILYESTKVCPSCLFVYCFESHHPFQDLFFKLIKNIVYIESSSRSMAINLHSIINHYIEANLLIQNPSEQIRKKSDLDNENDNKESEDDFLLVEKISSENIFESKSIVTVKDLNDDSKNIAKINDPFKLQDVDEKILNGQNSTNFSWPENSFESRDSFLQILYNDTILPEIGEEMAVRINRSSLSKFVWRRPTIKEYCMSISNFGIDVLLEWINLDDFIRILSIVFLEYSIIIYGSEIELIHRLVSSLSHIIFPFSWVSIILTIIPDSKLDMIDSPVPFIGGLYKSTSVINKVKSVEYFEKIVIIDIDDHHIEWPQCSDPKIACFETYHENLSKFCSKKKNVIDHSGLHKNFYPHEIKRKDDDIIIIDLNEKNTKKKPALSNPFKKNINLYFDLNRIPDIVATIFKLNHDVFVSKIYPSIVTRVKRDDIDTHGKEAISSMMVDEIYLSQFRNQENDYPFLHLFMDTQLFTSYRDQACRLKSDEEVDSLHLTHSDEYKSSYLKDISVSLSSGFNMDNS